MEANYFAYHMRQSLWKYVVSGACQPTLSVNLLWKNSKEYIFVRKKYWKCLLKEIHLERNPI